MAGEVTVDNTVMAMMEVEEMTLVVAIRDGRGGTLTMNNLESRHQVCSVNSSPLLLIKLTSTRGGRKYLHFTTHLHCDVEVDPINFFV